MRVRRRKVGCAGIFSADNENRRAAVAHVADELVDAGSGLIRLAEEEHGKMRTEQRHRAVAHLGRAECLCLDLARLLELERCFLRDSKTWAAADDEQSPDPGQAF